MNDATCAAHAEPTTVARDPTQNAIRLREQRVLLLHGRLRGGNVPDHDAEHGLRHHVRDLYRGHEQNPSRPGTTERMQW